MQTLSSEVFWLPYIVNRMQEQGVINALRDPEGITKTDRPWAERIIQKQRR